LFVSICIVASTSARAAVNYEFIKVNCNSDAEILIVSSFLDSDHSGEARAKHPDDNTYYLEELAKRGEEKLACDLGNNQVVSVEGMYSAAHPRDDGFQIYSGQKGIGSYFSPRDPIVIVRNLFPDNELEVTTCQEKTISVERECSITKVPYQRTSQQ
jgi:hypothetical protein